MERVRDPLTTHGYPEIWRVELYGQLLRGKSAEAKRLDYVAGSASEDPWQNYQKTPSQIIRVYDSLRRFSGAAGDKFWVIAKPDSKRWEVLGPAEGAAAPSIVRFELAGSIARGGKADAYPVSWDDDLEAYVLGDDLILVQDFSKSVPTSLGPGTRGLAVELTDRPGVYEIIEIERAVTTNGSPLIRFVLTTELKRHGTASAQQVSWNNVSYNFGGDEFVVRDWSGSREGGGAGVGHFQGQIGSYGWALEPADRTGQYEIVWMESLAHEIEVTLQTDILESDDEHHQAYARCTLNNWFRGIAPGDVGQSDFVVYDGHGAFTNYKSGAKAKATWYPEDENSLLDIDNQDGDALVSAGNGSYQFVFIEHPAKWAWGKVKSSFTTSNQFATVEIVQTWDGVEHDVGVEVPAENPPNYKETGDPYIFEATISGTEYHTCRVSYDIASDAWKLDWVVC